MRLHRFYISETVGLKTELIVESAGMADQIRKVFRLKTGDSVIVFDGSGSDYMCRIEDFGKESVTLAVSEASKSRYMPTRDIYLCAAVVKKDTFEWIAEKATELGVTHIIPVMAERSEKKSLKEERLNKIVIEASEQSGRGSVPEIKQITELSEILNTKGAKMIAFHTDAEPLQRSDLGGSEPLFVFIGPEGGWTLDEVDLFHKSNVAVRSLGDQVLRAETAVVAALSTVIFSI